MRIMCRIGNWYDTFGTLRKYFSFAEDEPDEVIYVCSFWGFYMRQVHYCISNYRNTPGSADLGGFGQLPIHDTWVHTVIGFVGVI